MKKYKTELHCHTSEVSHCAGESAADTVEKYLKYGYSTLVLTNHLARSNFRHMGYGDDTSWEDKAKFYIEGYYKMKEAAAGRMNILFGAEIRFDDLWRSITPCTRMADRATVPFWIEEWSEYGKERRKC